MFKEVTFSCGHTEEIELPDNPQEAENRIKYLSENGLCPTCFREKIEKSESEVVLYIGIEGSPERFIITGPTKPYKEELAAAGWKWGKHKIPTFFGKGEYRLSWMHEDPEELPEFIARTVDLSRFASIVKQNARLDFTIENGATSPYWNGVVYHSKKQEGSTGSAYVYIDGDKVFLPNKDYDLAAKARKEKADQICISKV